MKSAAQLRVRGAKGKKPLTEHLPDTSRMDTAHTALDEVQVSSGKLPATTIPRNTYHSVVFGRKQMDEKGAVNMGDLLNTELNARVINNGDDGSSLLLQGLSGQNVKILVDGVPQVLGMSNEFDLQQLNLTNVERVELVEGPLSVQYGTNALAGTLNIITRKMDADKNWGFGLNTLAESVGQYNGGLWLGRNWKGWNATLDLGYTDFSGYASARYRSLVNNPTHTVRGYNWSPKQQLNGGLKLYRLWNGLQVGLQHNQFHQQVDSKGEQDAGTAYLTANDNLSISDRWNTSLFANGKLAENTYLDVANSYGQYRLDNTEYLVNVQNGTRKVLEDPVDVFRTWTFRASYSTFDIGKAEVNYQLGYDVALNGGHGESITDTAKSINDYGFYGGAGMKLFQQLDVRALFRYVYNNRYDAGVINLLGAGIPVVPAFSLKWQPLNTFNISASYSKAFRAPSFLELYRELINGSHYLIGNPLLTPELADNYMATAQWQLPLGKQEFNFRLSFYSNRIRNKIEMVQPDRASLPPQYQDIQVPRTYANIPLFKTKGINLGLEYRYSDLFSFRPGVGWLARSGSNSRGALYNSYDVNANVMYRLGRSGVRLIAFYKYNGAIAQFGIDEYGNLADQRLGGYHLLDLSANRSIWQRKISLTAGLKNVFGVTDVLQTGQGTDGLVAGTADLSAVPIAWGRTVFIKAALTL